MSVTKENCTECGIKLNEENKVKRRNLCKPCLNRQMREKRANNPEHAERMREASRRWGKGRKVYHRHKTAEYVFNIKNNGCCVDCGETRWQCLDFDHKDPSTKVMGVSTMVTKSKSIEEIQTEINKCELRCANCHRVKTASDNKHYHFLLDQDENEH